MREVNDHDPTCPDCGYDMFWEDCWNCVDGFSHHDCGEDCCCCLDDEPNVVCDICYGNGGYYICRNSECKNPKPKEP